MTETKKRIRGLICACHAILTIAALVFLAIDLLHGTKGQAICESAMLVYHLFRFLRMH